MTQMARSGSLPGLTLAGRSSLLVTGALVVVGFGAVVPVLPQISRHFASVPGADTVVRALVTSLGGAMAIGAPVAGLLAERVGERTVLITALAVFAAAGAAGLVIDDVWLLLVDRIVVGLALASIGVAALAMLANSLPPAQRNRWMGFSSTLSNAATLVVMPIAAVLASIEWRLVFTLNLLALPMIALIVAFVPATRVEHPGRDGPAPGLPQEGGDAHRGLGFSLGLVLIGLACGAVGTALPAYLPYRFAEIGEPSLSFSAAALMGLTLGGAISAFLYGWVRRIAGPSPVFAAGFAVIGAALLILTLLATPNAMVVGMTITGAGVGLISPNLFAIAADAPTRLTARRIGVARASYFGAALVAQLPLEPIAARYGAGGAFLAVSGFALTMAVAFLAIRSRAVDTPPSLSDTPG